MLFESLGPFPYGTREDFLTDLEDIEKAPYHPEEKFPSSLAPNGYVSWQTLTSTDDGYIGIAYNDIDWAAHRAAVGWSGLQYKTLLRRKFKVHEHASFRCCLRAGLSFSIDGIHYRGDTYNYAAELSEDIASHLISMEPGEHLLTIYVAYEIRLFGDPKERAPTINCCFRMKPVRNGQLCLCHATSIYPDIVEGWLAGDYVGLALKNYANDTYQVIQATARVRDETVVTAYTKGEHVLRSGQSYQLPVGCKLRNMSDPTEMFISLQIRPDQSEDTFSVECNLSMRQTSRHEPYTFTFVDIDGTIQSAVARPPSCPNETSASPVILALHGAGVKQSPGDFWTTALDAQASSWIIFASGRRSWGLDWHSSSLRNALQAVESFARHGYGSWYKPQDRYVDSTKFFVVGHSNGGQGAMYFMQRYPDMIIGGISAAGYSDIQSYVPYTQWSLRQNMDPQLLSLLMASLTPFNNELHASNITGLENRILLRAGSQDNNVPPFHSRTIKMLIEKWNGKPNSTQLDIVPNQQHWWNKVLSERQDFVDKILSLSSAPKVPDHFTITCADPNETGSKAGIRIIELEHPGRLARVDVKIDDSTTASSVQLSTRNVSRISMQKWKRSTKVVVDSSLVCTVDGGAITTLEKTGNGIWQVAACTHTIHPGGSLMRFFDNRGPFVIVIGQCAAHLSLAQRLAQDYFLYLACNSIILRDVEVPRQLEVLQRSNIVCIGNTEENSLSKLVLDQDKTIKAQHALFRVSEKVFNEMGTGIISTLRHPFNASGLTMLLTGVDDGGLESAFRFTPLRTGIALSDWMVVKSNEILAAGYWDSRFGFNPIMSYMA